jgi:hypothetical protein
MISGCLRSTRRAGSSRVVRFILSNAMQVGAVVRNASRRGNPAELNTGGRNYCKYNIICNYKYLSIVDELGSSVPGGCGRL